MDLTANKLNMLKKNNVQMECDNNVNFTTFDDVKNIYMEKSMRKKYTGKIFKRVENDIKTTIMKMKKNGASFIDENVIKKCLLDFYIDSNNNTYEASLDNLNTEKKGVILKCDFCGMDIAQVLQGSQLVRQFIPNAFSKNSDIINIDLPTTEELTVKDLKEKLVFVSPEYEKIFTKEGKHKIQKIIDRHGFGRTLLFLQGMIDNNNSIITVKTYIYTLSQLVDNWENRKSIILTHKSKVMRNTYIKALKSFQKHIGEYDPELNKKLKLTNIVSKKTLTFQYQDVYVEVYALSQYCFEKQNLKLIKKALIIMIMFETAFRISDIANLKFENLQFIVDRYSLNIITNKTNTPISVFITDLCGKMINFIKENSSKEKIFIFSDDITTTTRNIRKHLNYIIEKIPNDFENLKRIRPHDFRRLLLSKLANMSDISYAKKISGHSNINTLALYLRGFNEEEFEKIHKCLQDNNKYKKQKELNIHQINKKIEILKKKIAFN